jgi:hypothetical protein
MANISTDFNINPYYDDFDEDKGFLRVLFRPSYAVQGRELTQLQTILQKQVSRFGDHIFKDGSKVLGGELTLDTEVSFLKLDSAATASTYAGGVINDTSAAVGAGTARAQVISTVAGIGSDPPTLIIKYLSGDTFSSSSAIFLEGTVTSTTTANVNHTGNASIVSVNRGIYYVNGFFVLVLPQTLILEKYGSTPSYRVGLSITESIIDSSTDTTLLDPAAGTTNSNAPGATRFKLEVVLAKKEISSTDPVVANASTEFIEILRIENGILTKHTKFPIYSELEKTMARRTYDESGDYTIRPFPIQVLDHQGALGITIADSDTTITGTNSDFLTNFEVGDSIYMSSDTTSYANVTSITNAFSMVVSNALGDGSSQTIYNRNRVSAAVEPGKAYVKGFEFETIGPNFIDVKKGRVTDISTSLPITPNFGNNIKVTNVDFGSTSGMMFDPENLGHQYDLHCVKSGDINISNQNLYESTKIGTTRIRQIDYVSGTFTNAATSNTAVFDAYLFDTQLSSVSFNAGATYISGATTIELDGTESSRTNDAYNGAKITMLGETRTITDTVYTVQSTLLLDGSTILGSDAGDRILEEGGGLLLTEDSGNPVTMVTLDYGFSAGASTSTALTINFSNREIEGLANQASWAIAGRPKMDVDITSKVNQQNAASNTKIFDTNLNSLVFPIGIDNVKGLNSQGLSWRTKRVYRAQTISPPGSGNAKLTLTQSGNYTFETEGKSGGTNLESSQANYIVVVSTPPSSVTHSVGGSNITTGTYFPEVGQILDCDISATTNEELVITPKLNGGTFTALGSDLIVDIHATLNTDGGLTHYTKTYTATTIPSSSTNIDGYNTITTNTPTRLTAGQFVAQPFTGTQSLQVSDVYSIHAIIEATGSTGNHGDFTLIPTIAGDTSHTNNITSRYIFNNGQKDNFIDHASITLKAGQTKPTNNILVLFNYFAHGSGSYASVDSYTGITYENIPAFISPITGIRKELRDSIDFRPIKSSGSGGTLPSGHLDMPDVDVAMTANVQFYLGRNDKLALSKDRVFRVIEGVSSENPILPVDDDDAMTIYNLDIPAYTFNASDVDTQYIDNRRFTMRDIGKIEKRMDAVEYYTALSLLEKEANDLSIKDEKTGTERFKSGVLVDSFNGHNIGDVSNEDFKAAIDFEMKELRPSFYSDSFKFTHDSVGSSANTTKTGDLVTLAYSSSNLVVQPLSSNTETLNPFGTTQFNGQLTLTPPSDVWYSETGRPTVLINLEGLNDHWIDGNGNGFGRQWDDWSFAWSGVSVNDDNLIKTRKTSSTTNTISRFAKTIEDNKTRTGIISTKPPETIKRSIGIRSVSISIVPFMREQRIQFLAKGVKPNQRMFPFFDSQGVSANTKPAYVLTFSANTSSANSGVFNTRAGEQVVLTQRNTDGNNNTINATAIALYQNSSAVVVSDIIQECTLTKQSHHASVSIGETIVFTDGTDTITSKLQEVNADANTITVNSISGAIATGMELSGSVSGAFSAISVMATGAITTGQIFSGIGSAKANGSVTAIPTTFSTYGSSLTSDKNGVVGGEFLVQPSTYRTGDRLFRLTNSSTNTGSETVTVAEQIYRTAGLLETRAGRISATRPIEAKRENVKDENITQSALNRISTSTNFVNPLSQTFIVDRNLHENGVFVNSVDIFFAYTDDILPVTLSLRPVINEAPSSSQIVPFGEVTLNGSECNANVSAPSLATSTTYTTFTFDSPVYLYPDEYAICLSTPSTEYQVHTSSLGQIVRNTSSAKVSLQPFCVAFFESQNSSLWQPNIERQMMFRINRCEFDSGSHSAYFSLEGKPLSGNTSGIDYDLMKLSTSELMFSNTTCTYSYMSIPKTSTVTSDSLRTSQIESSFTAFSPNKNITLTEQKQIVSSANTSSSAVSYSANNFFLRTVMQSTDSKISPAIDMSRINLITVENEINRGSFTNSDVVITSSGTGYTNGAFSITGTGGSSANVTIVTDGSGVISSAYISSAGSGYYEDASVTLTGGTSGEISIQDELGSDGGNCKTRYISRRVTLKDGFDAQDLKVFVNAYKPKDTDIKIYYRVHNAEDPANFEDKPYVLFTQETDSNLYSSNENDVQEYVYRSSANSITYAVGTQTYDNFKTFAIKIVLGSASTSIIPKVKDMKAIALDF